jgi:hypothetical protein
MSPLLRPRLFIKIAIVSALLTGAMIASRVVIALEDCTGERHSTKKCEANQECKPETGCKDEISANDVGYCTGDESRKSDNCITTEEDILCSTQTPCKASATKCSCIQGTSYDNPALASVNGGQCNVPKPKGG